MSAPRIPIEVEVEVEPGYGWIKDMPSYRAIVSTLGEIVAETEWGSYQGDSLYMVKGEQGYGILTFGWGSCSGCDSLEACSSQADIDALQDDLERGIRWFTTLGEAVAFVEGGGLKDSYLDDEMIAAFLQVSRAVES